MEEDCLPCQESGGLGGGRALVRHPHQLQKIVIVKILEVLKYQGFGNFSEFHQDCQIMAKKAIFCQLQPEVETWLMSPQGCFHIAGEEFWQGQSKIALPLRLL